MDCKALIEPERLANLIADLEGTTCKAWRSDAYTCFAQSVDEPGRRRLWVIPRDAKAGPNPGLWIRNHAKLFDELIDRSVTQATAVFPGAFPQNVQHQWLDIPSLAEASEGPSSARKRRARREIRATSAAAHIWIDRLRAFDATGNINEQLRREQLRRWGGRYWTKDMEDIYVQPNLLLVDESSQVEEVARGGLLATKPACLENALTVVYGHGGAGKTFFLSRLAERLTSGAVSDVTSSVPVLIRLVGVLHKDALENWLSRNGFGQLTLAQIGNLVRHGVVVPIIDALDEVVKGEARQGSEEFLDQLIGSLASDTPGRGVLACRDYYLTSDRALVRERLQGSGSAELTIGPFDRQDTRRFIQARTGLSPEHASRWADALEAQAKEIVGEDDELEVIRHPVFLDTLSRYIKDLPQESRMNAVDEFRLSRGDVFGQIVDELLKREQQKHAPLWNEAFEGRLEAEWMDPFDLERQRRVLRHVTLLVARDGRLASSDDPRRAEFRHGVFLSTEGVPVAAKPREALEGLLCAILGVPKPSAAVSEEKHDEVQRSAIAHLAEAYATHILASTEPQRPDDLVFALRHRFYFDYFLADALLEETQRALGGGLGSDLVNWCLQHHVGGPFDGCLDFLAWDPRIAREGIDRLRDFFRSQAPMDDVLASYLLSLSLAIFLRRRLPEGNRLMELGQFAPRPDLELLLMEEFLPDDLGNFTLSSCSFPLLTISISLSDLNVESCDFQAIRIIGRPSAKIARCHIEDVECAELRIEGNVTFADTHMDFEGSIAVADGARVELYNCRLSEPVFEAFEQARAAGADVKLANVSKIERAAIVDTKLSPGRRFVNKLMSLVRKEGHSEFAVYYYKFRDRTPGEDHQFSAAMDILKRHEIVEERGPMVMMAPVGVPEMYRPQLVGQPGYDSHDPFWEPIVKELDAILS